MTYIPLHTTLAGDLVSESAALNNNFLEIDGQLPGFIASNGSGNAPISVLNPEIGMNVYSSYVPDAGGAAIYVSDGTNWHASDQKETWGAWVNVVPTDVNPMNSMFLRYRLSNFGRAEWAAVVNPSVTPAQGQWTRFLDPNLQSSGLRLPWANFAPNPIGGATGPFIFDGQYPFNGLGAGGFGEQVRWAFLPLLVGGTNYVCIDYCPTWISLSSNGWISHELACIYDATPGYAGSLV